MCRTLKLSWYNLFSLSSIDPNSNLLKRRGVYVWIYSNDSFKRIIYVGTTTRDKGFRIRLGEHIGNLLVGLGTFFTVESNNDPYNILNKNLKQINGLVEQNKFWYPENNLIEKSIGNIFQNNLKDYMSKVSIWVCPFDNDDLIVDQSKTLEAKIIYAIKNKYNITSFSGWKNDSWIGRISKTKNLDEYHFNFNNLPDVDAETLKLFMKLDEGC